MGIGSHLRQDRAVTRPFFRRLLIGSPTFVRNKKEQSPMVRIGLVSGSYRCHRTTSGFTDAIRPCVLQESVVKWGKELSSAPWPDRDRSVCQSGQDFHRSLSHKWPQRRRGSLMEAGLEDQVKRCRQISRWEQPAPQTTDGS